MKKVQHIKSQIMKVNLKKSELKAYIAMKNQIILKMIFYMLKQDILLILQVLLYHLTIKNMNIFLQIKKLRWQENIHIY